MFSVADEYNWRVRVLGIVSSVLGGVTSEVLGDFETGLPDLEWLVGKNM